MATQLQENEFLTRYKDDYRDSDNYYRVLFNTGRSLQARELTQLQTIIQSEMARFGNYVFKQNTLISGGDQTFDNKVQYVKLDTSNPSYELPVAYQDLVGRTIYNSAGVKAVVKAVVLAEDDDPDTLIVTYVDSGSQTNDDDKTPVSFKKNQVLTYPESDEVGASTAQLKVLNSNTAVGDSAMMSVPSSVYYVLGHFVFVNPQSIVLSKYNNEPNTVVGFQVEQEIVTVDDDLALYDNSGVTPNLSAPGADRYRIRLILVKENDADEDKTFIPAFKYIDGRPIALGDPQNSLNVINDILAVRTKEESGDYVVKGFDLKIHNNPDSSAELLLGIKDGIAYFNGTRYDIKGLQFSNVGIQKPRSTVKKKSEKINANYGSYVVAKKLRGLLTTVSNITKVNLQDSADFAGSKIGTAFIANIDTVKNNSYKNYLFNIKMNSGKFISQVKSLGLDSNNYATIDRSSGTTVLYDQFNNDPIFPLPWTRPAAITNTTLTVVKSDFTGVVVSGGQATFNTGSADLIFANSGQWILTYSDGTAPPTVTIAAGGTGTTSVTFSGLTNSKTVNLLAYVTKTGRARSKTYTIATQTGVTPAASGTTTLDHADGIRLLSVKDETNNKDITYRYSFDTGIRDTTYEMASLVLNPGESNPAGTIEVQYSYYAHGGSGDYFNVESYKSSYGIEKANNNPYSYADIPTYRKSSTGDLLDMRDHFDFRSVKSNNTTFGIKFALPLNTSNIVGDVDYYNASTSYVVLNSRGNIRTVTSTGRPPAPPSLSKNEFVLHTVQCEPYVINLNDVTTIEADNRRYTMKDLRSLEKRVQRVEELTTLTMLELETNKLSVVDENGLERTKLGLTADEFKDFAFSDVKAPDWRAGIDVVSQQVTPPEYSTNINVNIWDSAASTNIVKKKNFLLPSYSHVKAIEQKKATSPITVIQYAGSFYGGKLELNPNTDTWDQSIILTATNTTNDTVTLTEGNLNKINPLDKDAIDLETYGWTDVVEGTKDIKTTGNTTVTSGLVDTEALNIQRSNFVFFKASGLKPNTRHYVFFDNKNVDIWVQTGTGKFDLSSNSKYASPGDSYINTTQYPIDGGPTASHISNAFGELEGILFIQSNTTVNYPTGSVPFSITDVNSSSTKKASSTTSTSFVSAGKLDIYIQNTYTKSSSGSSNSSNQIVFWVDPCDGKLYSGTAGSRDLHNGINPMDAGYHGTNASWGWE